MIHEIFYGSFPLTYTPVLAKDILNLWNNEFLYIIRGQKRKGLKILDTIFQLVNLLLVRVNQSERLELAKAYMILKSAEDYADSINDFIVDEREI